MEGGKRAEILRVKAGCKQNAGIGRRRDEDAATLAHAMASTSVTYGETSQLFSSGSSGACPTICGSNSRNAKSQFRFLRRIRGAVREVFRTGPSRLRLFQSSEVWNAVPGGSQDDRPKLNGGTQQQQPCVLSSANANQTRKSTDHGDARIGSRNRDEYCCSRRTYNPPPRGEEATSTSLG